MVLQAIVATLPSRIRMQIRQNQRSCTLHIRHLGLLLGCLLFLAGTRISAATISEQIQELLQRQGLVRIGLGRFTPPVKLTADSYLIIQSSDAGSKASPIPCRDAVINTAVDRLTVKFDGNSLNCASVTIATPNAGDEIQLGGRRYLGIIHIRATKGRLDIINELPLDDYVACVLKAEIGPAPHEALKAQAVVARSEAIHKLKLRRHATEGYDLCASEHCMAYQGSSGVTPDMKRAAFDTKGEVLAAGGEVLDAVFHTMCGGITAGAEDVWDSPPIPGLQPVWDGVGRTSAPYFRSEEEVETFLMRPPAGCFCDPADGHFPAYARKYYRWTKNFSATDLQRLLGATVRDLKILERRPSGRVRKLAVITATGERIIEKELPIRKQFDLPSGLFVVHVIRNRGMVESLEFLGAGSGHGVGLCQMGAWAMAEKGFRYDAILLHYYPRARLMQLYR